MWKEEGDIDAAARYKELRDGKHDMAVIEIEAENRERHKIYPAVTAKDGKLERKNKMMTDCLKYTFHPMD